MNPTDMPSFPKHDPASTEFWNARFDAEFTPWDQGGVPKLFTAFVEAHTPKRTLIPGCGSAHEVALLATKGWDVTAIDFSPAAIAKAQQLLGVFASHVREQDFFDVALTAAPFDVVYERAFLCALPPRLREDWVMQVAKLVAPQGLLAGYFFFDSQPDAGPKGPPFGITEEALNALLNDAGFNLVESLVPDDSIPVFKGKERWMIWQRVAA